MRIRRTRRLRGGNGSTLPQKLAVLVVVAAGAVEEGRSWYGHHREAVDHFLSWFVPVSCAALALGVALSIWLWLRHRRAGRPVDRRRVEDPRFDDLTKPSASGRNDGKRLEHLTADLLTAEGLEDVEVPGGAGDLGGDVVGYLVEDGRRLKVVVQCKEYRRDRLVPSKDMQAFPTTAWGWPHYADIAIFVTSARGFSDDGAELAYQNQILTLSYSDLEQVARGERTIIPPAPVGQPIGGAA